MTVLVGEPSAESEEKWAARSEALARWLLAEWQRELEEKECGRGDSCVKSERRIGS
jgi:hypothetical protein